MDEVTLKRKNLAQIVLWLAQAGQIAESVERTGEADKVWSKMTDVLGDFPAAEPPAEPDLDELTPRCPVCEETMHDCECNPYMGSGGDDGDYANMTPGEAFDEGFAAGYAEAEQEVDT